MTTLEDAPAVASPEIGKDRRRKEDQRLITGRTRWTDNLTVPGMLHLAIVRSPHAHAKILGIDTSAANAATNIYDVFTGKDLAETQGVMINAWPISPDQKAPTHLPLAIDRVTFAGEVVAVIVARSAAEARDAAELVDVDYEVLPAVLDHRGRPEDEVLAHPDLGTNKSAFWQFDSANAGTGGNVDEAIEKARADGIVIDPRPGAAAPDPGVHGAEVRARRPDGRADHHVERDADPAHRPVRARRHHGRARVEDPGDRPRRGRRLRRQAGADPGGVDQLRGGPPAGQAGEVHRDPQRESW